MSGQNGGKKLTFEDKPKANVPAMTPAEGQQNPGEEEVKYTFGYCLMHPIKAVKHLNEEHPVGTKVAGVLTAAGLVVVGKCVVDAFTGGKSEDGDELEDEMDYDEEEDEEEEEDED